MIFNMTGTNNNSMNFSVVGGTTQPAGLSENIFWVNTSTAITSWVFSSNIPASPSAGMVWFETVDDDSMSFDALENGGLKICPLSALQYVSGAWVDKATYIYQNGSWKALSARIPFTYQEVEYLEADGSPYIKTNFYTNTDYFAAKGRVMAISGTGSFFGSAYKVDSSHYPACYIEIYSGPNIRIANQTGYLDHKQAFSYGAVLDFDYEINLPAGTATSTYNGSTSTQTTSKSYGLSNIGMWIFCRNVTNSRVGTMPQRFYNMKWYLSDGVLSADFIPCYRKSDNKPGLYERVQGRFYTNANASGNDFTVGPMVI